MLDRYEVSYDLFVRLAEGKLTRDEERILDALGVKSTDVTMLVCIARTDICRL